MAELFRRWPNGALATAGKIRKGRGWLLVDVYVNADGTLVCRDMFGKKFPRKAIEIVFADPANGAFADQLVVTS